MRILWLLRPMVAAGAPRRRARRGPTRRAFLRGGMGAGLLLSVSGFAGASLAFLWPDLRGGFGAELTAPLDEEGLLEAIRGQRRPFEFGAGRAYLVEYDPALDPDGRYAEITQGARVMALYWRCVHLGCKVPWCMSSQWLECPCHGSQYNAWGEWQRGPAPRGLDRLPLRIEDGAVVIDTGQILTGPPRQSGVRQQPPEGPSCVRGA
jgi:cytochrome b6-f complex iron-sulfur subunit